MTFKDYIKETKSIYVKVKDIPVGTKKKVETEEWEFTNEHKKWIGKKIKVSPPPSISTHNWFHSDEWDTDKNTWSNLWFYKSWLDFPYGDYVAPEQEMDLDI